MNEFKRRDWEWPFACRILCLLILTYECNEMVMIIFYVVMIPEPATLINPRSLIHCIIPWLWNLSWAQVTLVRTTLSNGLPEAQE